MVKGNINFYLTLIFKHKILIKLNITNRKPFSRDQSSLFRRKANYSFTNSLHLKIFKFIEKFQTSHDITE